MHRTGAVFLLFVSVADACMVGAHALRFAAVLGNVANTCFGKWFNLCRYWRLPVGDDSALPAYRACEQAFPLAVALSAWHHRLGHHYRSRTFQRCPDF